MDILLLNKLPAEARIEIIRLPETWMVVVFAPGHKHHYTSLNFSLDEAITKGVALWAECDADPSLIPPIKEFVPNPSLIKDCNPPDQQAL